MSTSGIGPISEHDAWKLQTPEDAADEQERRMPDEEDFYDKGDRLYQERKEGDRGIP